MSDEAHWSDLRPLLQDLTARIARIEQFLAASGFQASSGPGTFDGVPNSFDAAPGVFNAPPIPTGSGPVPDYLVVLARSGRKIQAIQELRTLTGMGLKEAKALIDQVTRGY